LVTLLEPMYRNLAIFFLNFGWILIIENLQKKNLILALRILIFGYRHPVKKHHTMKDDGW